MAVFVACGAQPAPTPSPMVERSPAEALRPRAEAFALARTEARFEDTYAFTLPSFREACPYENWVGGLIVEARVTRAFAGLDDDEPLTWRVELVEVDGERGTVVESVLAFGSRGLAVEPRPWAFEDGEWWLDFSPEDICNL